LRKIPFSASFFLYRERDFMGNPAAEIIFRSENRRREVRLKYGYINQSDEVIKDASGNVTELRCTATFDSNQADRTPAQRLKGNITG